MYSNRTASLCVVQTATWLDALYYSNAVFIYILAIILKDLRDEPCMSSWMVNFDNTLTKVYLVCLYNYIISYCSLKSIKVTNNIFLHKHTHYSHANVFIFMTSVAGYIAILACSLVIKEKLFLHFVHACHCFF